jgi:hypothetical protein
MNNRPKNDFYILVIIGSRTLERQIWIKDIIRNEIKKHIDIHREKLLVASGDAIGIDRFAQEIFEEETNRKPIIKKSKKNSWYWHKKRSIELNTICNYEICLFDYESRTFGGLWTYNHCNKPKKLYVIYNNKILKIIENKNYEVGPPNTKYNYRFKKTR